MRKTRIPNEKTKLEVTLLSSSKGHAQAFHEEVRFMKRLLHSPFA